MDTDSRDKRCVNPAGSRQSVLANGKDQIEPSFTFYSEVLSVSLLQVRRNFKMQIADRNLNDHAELSPNAKLVVEQVDGLSLMQVAIFCFENGEAKRSDK
ncbi:hypothetical protein BWQ96_04455 [Gracilariopsis chorda]|uniref:Uncharacterized protein n=1 Tax=Gracilariopsis chorda TaxID=448386 RepID=A0A2V3IUG6_9FLOR|nr:hypothetical protein BWQ96_04455 [Gracilariopsis chorda]|eukprot:PXF45788.1 hypothetical protein BWQ96_04455 [Gracilariopsis chorda]